MRKAFPKPDLLPEETRPTNKEKLFRGLLPVHPITIETHETGFVLAERYNLSTYDAMIAASALHANCDALWSEDMQHGMVLEGRLRIADPFRDA